MRNWVLTALVALVAGFAGAAAFSWSPLGEARTREYLLANPQILPEMADAYQRQENAKRLASIAGDVQTSFPGAVLGNPKGKHVLVKFTDYGCTYCRASVADIDRLIAADPDLRVVVREWPVFENSERAARMGLAAAKQGKLAAFYHAMFAAGPPSDTTIARAAQGAGLDMAAAEAFAASPEATAELQKTAAMAQQLGFEGTPSWVAGDEVFSGYVGYDKLAEAVGFKPR